MMVPAPSHGVWTSDGISNQRDNDDKSMYPFFIPLQPLFFARDQLHFKLYRR